MEQILTERTKQLITLVRNAQLQKEILELFEISFIGIGLSPIQENERVHFSVIKCAMESNESFNLAKLFYKEDIRDLFMQAGFGFDPNEHDRWCDIVLNKKKTTNDNCQKAE